MGSVISIVGKSGVGKTTLIEQLITEFKQRGYTIAIVKHSRESLELDQPGKDSQRFTQMGSEAVIISSPDRLIFTKTVEHDLTIEEILHFIGSDFDLVLTEGFRSDKAPKIEVHRKEEGEDLLCAAEELSAIATDEPLDIDIPQLPLGDSRAIADFIERSFLSQIEEDAYLFVNGKSIHMIPFVKEIITRVVLAMVSTLKGVGEIKSLNISVKRKSLR